MKPKELTDLEALARASIIVSESEDWYFSNVFWDGNTVDSDVDAKFIAAASPKVVLELIEQINQSKAKNGKSK